MTKTTVVEIEVVDNGYTVKFRGPAVPKVKVYESLSDVFEDIWNEMIGSSFAKACRSWLGTKGYTVEAPPCGCEKDAP